MPAPIGGFKGFLHNTKAKVKEHPKKTAGIVAGGAVVLGGGYYLYNKSKEDKNA